MFSRLYHSVTLSAFDPMPFKSCLPLFLFGSKFGGWEIKSADEFEINVNLLNPVAVNLFGSE